MRRAVLIISASMGAGHDGAARELQHRLDARGHRTELHDFLQMAPFDIGALVRWTYRLQLRFAPWTYEVTYRYLLPVFYWPCVFIDSFCTKRRLRKAVRDFAPDVIVCTFGLPALVLGRWRRKGLLRIPVVTFCTDFSVHQMWVHHGVDVHLTVSPRSAELAERRSRGETRAPGPLVREQFRLAHPDRDEARAWLGIGPRERAVLVVAGSWGVGEVVPTVQAIVAAGEYHPITVCGRDEELRAQLTALGIGTVIGWTDAMPRLMAAADALVENAGGLTCMEAFAFGLPVVTYQPIPGHGRDNAATMASVGVNRYAHSDRELAVALGEVTRPGPARDRLIVSARKLFAGDATEDVLDVATRADGVVVPLRTPKAPRRAAIVAASLAMVYGGLTVGAQGVAALGVGVARPPAGKAAAGHAYIGVRLDAAQLADPAVRSKVARLHGTAIVDGRTAATHPGELEALAAVGVDVDNGGAGRRGNALRYYRARDDVARAADLIRSQTGVAPRDFVPERRIDAFDLVWSRRRHQHVVMPDRVFRPESVPLDLTGKKVYVLDGRNRDALAMRVALDELGDRTHRSHLIGSPLAELR